jgi:hypothetical protein
MKRRKNRLTAGTGKVLRRISDGTIAGKDIYLGIAYYMNGKKLDNPITELPEHYEEIDEPVMTEDSPVVAAPADILIETEVLKEETVQETGPEPESIQSEAHHEKVVITVRDFLELKDKVDRLLGELSMNGKDAEV